MNTRPYSVGWKRYALSLSVLAGAYAFAAAPAHAAVIYDNSIPSYDYAFSSEAHNRWGVADTFVLQPGAETITGIRWSGVYAFDNTPPSTDDFRIEIYADDGAGAPEQLASFGQDQDASNGLQRTATGSQLSGYDIYSYFLDVPALTLAPGTRYWLRIMNDTTADAYDDWFWLAQTGIGAAMGRTQLGAQWEPLDAMLDFQLEGPTNVPNPPSVPEPASMLLVGSGVVGLFFRGRKRKCANMTHSQCLAVAGTSRPFDSRQSS
jgi:hypothetical protein